MTAKFSNNEDYIELFEEQLSAYTNAPYVVAVGCCTNAIVLCLEYLRRYEDYKEPMAIPNRTYLSVPMTLMNYGYEIYFEYNPWFASYRIGNTPVWDCAVGFERNMYRKGEMQCLSFQQKKRLNIGKGGAILLDDIEQRDYLRRMRSDGRNSRVHMSLDLKDIIMGYHMYMSPDEAVKGSLLLNQLSEQYKNGSHLDYPDISQLECFNELRTNNSN